MWWYSIVKLDPIATFINFVANFGIMDFDEAITKLEKIGFMFNSNIYLISILQSETNYSTSVYLSTL